MAGRYTKQELKAMLHRSAFHLVAESGVESLTVRKVSAGCGLSDPYIYQCYSDLKELLTDAFLITDREVAELMRDTVKTLSFEGEKDLRQNCWVLWSAYWDYLMRDPEKTVFYWRFYQSGYYNREILEQRRKNFRVFTSFVGSAGKKLGADDSKSLDAIISCVIDSTVSVAVKMHLGYIEPGEMSAQTVCCCALSYLFYSLGQNGWDSPENIDIS